MTLAAFLYLSYAVVAIIAFAIGVWLGTRIERKRARRVPRMINFR